MERIFFRRIEVWVVGVLAVLGIVGTIAFGNIIVHTMKGGTKAGVVGEAAVMVSDVPAFIRSLHSESFLIVSESEHPGKSGFSFSYAPGSRPDAGYLLLSRYDADDMRSYVEFVDLNAQKVLHRWAPDIDGLNARANLVSNQIDLLADKNERRMLIRHPFVLEDGSLIFKSYSPLYKVDACSNFVWLNDTDIFHHSLERDGDGVFWTGTKLEPVSIRHVDPENFVDDAITAVDANGKILSAVSVAQILIDNRMWQFVYGGGEYRNNPIHLNDIERVEEDGPHWQKGDLFVSLRAPSMVFLYRPSTNKVIWSKVGPWLHQHDVDILDDHRISIYNNNSAEYFRHKGWVSTVEVDIYDFDTDEVVSPWKEALERLNVRATTSGVQTVLPNDELFIEEENFGRILLLTREGEVVWEYVNRAKGGRISRVSWSRLIEQERGSKIAAALAKAHCGRPSS